MILFCVSSVCVCVCTLSHSVVSNSLQPQACQTPLPMGFSRPELWGGLPFSPLGDLPKPGIEPTSLEAPTLADRFFTTELPGKPCVTRGSIFLAL